MNDLVSIIIPIYNAEKYLNRCLESIIAQTYKHLEILLINDGSTDGSLPICNSYAAADSRIKVFSKKNAGQGMARNMGIKKSHGNYIMFTDADDWVDACIVEKLLKNIKDQKSSIAICNYYKTVLNDDSKIYKVEEITDDRPYILLDEDKDFILRISTYPWGKLYDSKIFRNSSVEFPPHFYEDVAVMPVIFALANKISFFCEPLYYYRNHSGSTANSVNHIDDRIRCIETMIECFKNQGLYEKYDQQIERCIVKRTQINVRMARTALSCRFNEFIEKQSETVKKYYFDLEINIPDVCVIGSYSLMTAAKVVMHYDNDKSIEQYYGRESIISIMSEGKYVNRFKVFHENRMKWKCLVNDFSKRLRNNNSSEFKNIDYIFIDLLEERYDIGKYRNEYFTVSDAFLEIESSLDIPYQIIPSFTDEWFDLWKKKCRQFVKMLLEYAEPEQIVLVRMKLSEKYKKENRKIYFADAERIRESNERLQACYDYFAGLNHKIQDISVEQLDFYVTSADFRHGCFPWHLGNMAYEQLGEYIGDKLITCGEGKIENTSMQCHKAGKNNEK